MEQSFPHSENFEILKNPKKEICNVPAIFWIRSFNFRKNGAAEILKILPGEKQNKIQLISGSTIFFYFRHNSLDYRRGQNLGVLNVEPVKKLEGGKFIYPLRQAGELATEIGPDKRLYLSVPTICVCARRGF